MILSKQYLKFSLLSASENVFITYFYIFTYDVTPKFKRVHKTIKNIHILLRQIISQFLKIIFDYVLDLSPIFHLVVLNVFMI